MKTTDNSSDSQSSSLFRRTLVRVMTVQVLTLLLLWLLQARYGG